MSEIREQWIIVCDLGKDFPRGYVGPFRFRGEAEVAASGLGAAAVLKFKGLIALPSFVRTGSVFKFKVLTPSPSFARNGSANSPKVRTCFSIRHSCA